MNKTRIVCYILAFVLVCIILLNTLAYNLMFTVVDLNQYHWPVLSSPYQGYYINTYWQSLPGEFVSKVNGNSGGVSGTVTDTKYNTTSYIRTTSSVTTCPIVTLGVYTPAAALALISNTTADASLSSSDLALINDHNAAVLAVNCGLVGVFITPPASGGTIIADPIMPIIINIGLVLSPPATAMITPIA